MTHRLAASLLIAIALSAPAHARQAASTMESRTLLTYPYGDPDPVPMLSRDTRLYPYHAFDGYSVTGRDSAWSVVRLENDQVIAWVLPDVGGKVWGAVEKSGGEEFIYRNEVMKFRNIALRGPWTSGGIELNFGVIGHAPWTAAPVDFVMEQNEDGSASIVVGAMDIPSRTQWRVRISVPSEGAYVQTEALWFNPTPFTQAYYNWMTAAAFARDDLQLVVPGDRYLRHSGEALPWPVDDSGRRLSRYAENTFEGHKSYHVVGAFEDFFGGYYESEDWGFGHWSPYSDMPGQKMWLWALSDEGGIWEDLLTDTDGQYVEWQAGRLLVQYSPGAHLNPITQAAFEPGVSDRWTERWFPVIGIGGMSEASDRGAMHVTIAGNELLVGMNAFVATMDTLILQIEGSTVYREPLSLEPLQPVRSVIPLPNHGAFTVSLPELHLRFSSTPDSTRLRRPFRTDPDAIASRPESDRLVFDGRELARARRFPEARVALSQALTLDPWHPGALDATAELDLRQGRYEEALSSVRRLLQIDAYDPGANWLAGLTCRALGRRQDAQESFGWAARSIAHREAATAQLAEMALEEGDPLHALSLAREAATYQPAAFGALEIEAIALRLLGRPDDAARIRERLLRLDPLHHFARAEAWLDLPSDERREAFVSGIRSELPEQTWLEIAIDYARRGQTRDAERILSLAPVHPLIVVWRAWLSRESDPGTADDLLMSAASAFPGFVFPFRPESTPVLEWAAERHEAWSFDYWLALLYWSLDRPVAAGNLMQSLGETPDYGPFYAARAALRASESDYDARPDLDLAISLDPVTWQLRRRLIDHLASHGLWGEALEVAERASADFPGVFDLSLARARALIETGRPADAAAIMDTVVVLPSEMGRTSRQLYEWSHLALALDLAEPGNLEAARSEVIRSMEWPRRLGQGRPYDLDERLQHGLLAWISYRVGETDAAVAYADSVVSWTWSHPDASPVPAALVHVVLLRSGLAADAARVMEALAEARHDPLSGYAASRITRPADRTRPEASSDPGARLLLRALELTTSED